MPRSKTSERFAICAIGLLAAACSDEAPPPTVAEFMDNPVLLDAIVVRCGRNRDETKYEPECVNAREAVERLAVAAEDERREELKAQSERKRQALRRAQEAAAEARRRAHEAEEQRQQAAYLSQFGAAPGEAVTDSALPGAVLPAGTGLETATQGGVVTEGPVPESPAGSIDATTIDATTGDATTGGDARGDVAAPAATAQPEVGPSQPPPATADAGTVQAIGSEQAPASGSELKEVREELQERQHEPTP